MRWHHGSGCCGCLAAILLGVLLSFVLPSHCPAQSPVLVEVRVTGVATATVEARLLDDSTLELSAADVHALLGVAMATPWVSLPELARAWPSVSFRWLPSKLLLLIDDPRAVLPASQAAQAALQRSAQAASAFAYRTVSGVFGSISGNDSGRSLGELGYSWRGRVVVQGAYLPAAHRGLWSASLAPMPQVSAFIAGGRTVTMAALRVAAGPAFAFATVQNGRASLDGLIASHGVALFASSRNVFVLTIQRPGAALQVSRALHQTTARFSFGPQVTASPFFLPSVPHP